MKGVIDKIWKNETDDGKPHFVLKIGGEKYSVWDKKYMEGLEEGAVVEYESAQSGKFMKITNMRKIEPEPDVGHPERKTRDRNGEEIVRMSCIRSAAALVANFGAPPEEKAEITLGLARKFEKYAVDPGEAMKPLKENIDEKEDENQEVFLSIRRPGVRITLGAPFFQ